MEQKKPPDPDPLALWREIVGLAEKHPQNSLLMLADLHRLGRLLRVADVLPTPEGVAAVGLLRAKLAEVEQDYGISQKELDERLFPPLLIFPDGEPLELPVAAIWILGPALKETESRIELYTKALASLDCEESSGASGVERAVLHALRAGAVEHAQGLQELRRAAKLEPGRRGVSPAQWKAIGDRAADLALFLSGKIPGVWTRGKGIRGRLAPRRYRVTTLALAAELMTLAYRTHWPGFRMTPQQVKARLIARRGRSR